jgi:DNA-binding transcriptional ArsR family regulator
VIDTSLPESRFARIAAVIGDPTRARMLSVLLDGGALPAGELANAVNVSASTASQHLAMLAYEGLVSMEVRGRHRYFRLSDAEVAHALEALSLVAERSRSAEKWLREPYRTLKYARSCYRHLAGELGVRLLEVLLGRGYLTTGGNGYEITPAGVSWLSEIGVDAPRPGRAERYAYPCLDWSERRDHLAGPLATSLLDHFMARRWLVRRPQSRALKLTPLGRRALVPLFGPYARLTETPHLSGGGS